MPLKVSILAPLVSSGGGGCFQTGGEQFLSGLLPEKGQSMDISPLKVGSETMVGLEGSNF